MSLLKKCNTQGYNLTISCEDVISCVTTELTKITGDESTTLSNFCDAVAKCVDDQLLAIAEGESNDLDAFAAAITKIFQSFTGYSDSGEYFFKVIDGVLTWTASSPDSFFLEAGDGISLSGAGTSVNPMVVTSDITQYTDELAQDAIGTIFLDTATIDFTYTDATPEIKADVIVGAVDNTQTSLVVYTGTAFKQRTVASLNIPTALTFENGIYNDAGTVKLGGALAEDTVIGTIEGEDNNLTFWTNNFSAYAADTMYLSADDLNIAVTTISITSGLTQDDTKTRILVQDSVTGRLYWRNVTTVTGSFTNEAAQDAVGAILTSTATITLTYTDGADTITADVINDSITNAKLRNSVAYSVIGKSTTGTGDPADIVAAADGVLRRSGSGDLLFGSLVTANLGDGQVTFAKVQDINTQRLLGRTTAGSGDIESLTVGAHLKLTGGVLNAYGRTLIGITTFTSDGTWNKPTGCNAAIVYIVGAGGGSGSVDSATAEVSLGTGGGGGATLVIYKVAGLGASETVTVGVGGTGGVVGSPGSSGGLTSFGTHGTAGGGGGGLFLASGTTVAGAAGGQGGLVSVIPGDAVYSSGGQMGGMGVRFSGTSAIVGPGGSSTLGASAGVGTVYAGYGAGGSGLWDDNGTDIAGYDGQDGIVIVYEYS